MAAITMLDIRSSPRAKRVVPRPSLVDITNTPPSPLNLSLNLSSKAHTLPLLKHLRPANSSKSPQPSHPRCPISRLPSELLLHIAHLGTLEHFSFPLLFSHVCHIWRSLALSTPALWNTIILARSFDELLPPSYIHAILSRSRDTPLSLSLDLGQQRKTPDEPGAVWRASILLETVEPVASRWQSLSLSLPSAFDLDSFLSRTLPRAQGLEKFTLHRADSSRLSPTKHDLVMQDPVYLPNLRELKVDGFPLPGCIQRPTLATVTDLQLLCPPAESQLSAAELLNLLRGMRHLQRLSLVNCIRRSTSCDPPFSLSLSTTEALSLPRLTTLDISHNPTLPAHQLLSSLQLPGLRSLVLGSHPSYGTESLRPLCSLLTTHRYPALKRLRLGYGTLEVVDRLELGRRMDGVTVFGPLRGERGGVEEANRRWEAGVGGW